jgi:hypothetical protein
MIAHPRRSHGALGGLLATATLRLGQRLNLRLRNRLDCHVLSLRHLGQAGVSAVVIKEQHLAGDDHCSRAQLASRLVVPGLVLQAADNPHALALTHILIDDFGQASPGCDYVELHKMSRSYFSSVNLIHR